MSTIKEVARKADVSISTVSLAYNDPERVSETTRLCIFRAAKELNYSPARSKRQQENNTRASQTISVLIDGMISSFWFEVLRGISETLNIVHYEMALFSGEDAFTRHLMPLVMNRECAGVILLSPGESQEETLKIAAAEHFPIVLCESAESFEGISTVSTDNAEIGRKAADYFVHSGRNRIVLLGISPAHLKIRRDAFVKRLEEKGYTLPESLEIPCPLSEEGGYLAIASFLRKASAGTSRDGSLINTGDSANTIPDAVFGLNDDAAIGAIRAIQEYGLSVPEQVSVVGCDNISTGRFIRPSLTTFEIPKYEIGVMAANTVLHQISGMPPENIILNSRLIERESFCRKTESFQEK